VKSGLAFVTCGVPHESGNCGAIRVEVWKPPVFYECCEAVPAAFVSALGVATNLCHPKSSYCKRVVAKVAGEGQGDL